MMRLPKFEYHVPRTVAEAVRIMGERGPVGQFVAGGTDLYPNMKRRQQVPKSVISVMRLQELNQITGDGAGGLRIGASVTLTEIVEHPIINRDYPVVAKAARTISTPILRNMGTIGGNLLLDTRCNYYDQITNGARVLTSVSRRMETFAGSRRVARSVGPCSRRIWFR